MILKRKVAGRCICASTISTTPALRMRARLPYTVHSTHLGSLPGDSEEEMDPKMGRKHEIVKRDIQTPATSNHHNHHNHPYPGMSLKHEMAKRDIQTPTTPTTPTLR